MQLHILKRQRKTASFLGLLSLVLLFLSPPTPAVQAKAAMLNQTSFCQWGGGGGLDPLDLFEDPQEELTNKPTKENLLYGTLPYGNGKDPVSFAYKERFGKSPLLWIDSNNNENLGDDGEPTPDLAPSGWRTFTYTRQVEAKYVNSGNSHYVTVPVLINAMPDIAREGNDSWWDLVPSVSGTRRGTIELAGAERKIAIADGNWDGLFKPDDVFVFIDSDGDGEICQRCLHEAYLPGKTVWVGDESYEIASVAPSGRRIELESVDKDPSTRPFVTEPGHEMRDFRIETFGGKSFSLSSLRGEVVVLNFVPTLPPYEEKESRKWPQRERLENRINYVDDFLSKPKYEDVGFLLISIDPDYQPEKSKAKEFETWKVGWSPQLAKPQLLVGYSLVILDEKGIIRYTDELVRRWDSLGCEMPESRPAIGPEIQWALDRLLADDK